MRWPRVSPTPLARYGSGSRPLRRVLAVGVLFASVGSAQIEYLHGLGEVSHHAIRSEALATTYHVFVSTPAASSDSKSGKLPTVYLLDGGASFPALAAYHRYLHLGEEVPSAVIVGISYGTDDWRKGNQRGRDFTAPAADREHFGGAPAFARFLSQSVFPLIEERYPSDPARRIIFGQSLGGQFVLHAAQTSPGLFWGYIASNPALHRNLDYFLEATPEAVAGAPRRVFVASGSDDDPTFREPARRWIEHWTSREAPWQLETRTLPGENHFSPLPTAYRQGMVWLFSSP